DLLVPCIDNAVSVFRGGSGLGLHDPRPVDRPALCSRPGVQQRSRARVLVVTVAARSGLVCVVMHWSGAGWISDLQPQRAGAWIPVDSRAFVYCFRVAGEQPLDRQEAGGLQDAGTCL